jgi:SpoIID/LytB domain protein
MNLKKLIAISGIISSFFYPLPNGSFSFAQTTPSKAQAYKKVISLYDSGRFQESIEEYKKLADKGDIEAALNLAAVFKDLGYPWKGIAVLSSARPKSANDIRLESLLSRLYYLNNQPDEAIAILEKIIQKNPHDKDSFISLGLAYQDKGMEEKARECYEQAISLDKNNVIAHLSLADLYYRKQKLAESAEEYKQVSVIDASIQNINKYWAQVLYKTGNLKEAYRIYEKLRIAEPENKSVIRDFELVRKELGKEFFEQERAKRLASKEQKLTFVRPLLPIPNVQKVFVGLLETLEPVEFKCSVPFQMISKNKAVLAEGEAGLLYRVQKSDNVILIASEKDSMTVDNPVRIRLLKPEGTITIFNVGYGKSNFWADWQDRSYRGEIEISGTPKGLSARNIVNMEEYLYGVVPSEMSSQWPLEALKAQAIAARSESMAKLGRHKKEGFDFCSDVHCQVYSGVEKETAVTNQAVDETRGLIMRYNAKPVDAVYSSTCGGHTQDNIFSLKDIPYFRSVADILEKSDMKFPLSPYELEDWFKNPPEGILCDVPQYSRASNFRWVRIYSAEELRDIVSKTKDIGGIKKILVLKRKKSGHIDSVRIVGEKSSCVVGKELNIRKALGNLRSSMFKVEIKFGPEKKPKLFLFYGGGWGHGVGMCQAGACGMALRGRDYKDILRHYYHGVEFKNIY